MYSSKGRPPFAVSPGLPRKVESGARFPKVMFDPI
jgi:hypothetical protein